MPPTKKPTKRGAQRSTAAKPVALAPAPHHYVPFPPETIAAALVAKGEVSAVKHYYPQFFDGDTFLLGIPADRLPIGEVGRSRPAPSAPPPRPPLVLGEIGAAAGNHGGGMAAEALPIPPPPSCERQAGGPVDRRDGAAADLPMAGSGSSLGSPSVSGAQDVVARGNVGGGAADSAFTCPPLTCALQAGGATDGRALAPASLSMVGANTSPRPLPVSGNNGMVVERHVGTGVAGAEALPILPPSAGALQAGGPDDRHDSVPIGSPTQEAGVRSGSELLEGAQDTGILDSAAPTADNAGAEAALLAERLRSHSATSPRPASPPRQPGAAADADPWAWLTPAGLGAAGRAELKVPRTSVPHLVGRGGRTIQLIENLLGIIVGVGDGGEGEARVTLWGPKDRLAGGKRVVDCVVQGGRSLLRRLSNARLAVHS